MYVQTVRKKRKTTTSPLEIGDYVGGYELEEENIMYGSELSTFSNLHNGGETAMSRLLKKMTPCSSTTT